jgi:hypothetical protein
MKIRARSTVFGSSKAGAMAQRRGCSFTLECNVPRACEVASAGVKEEMMGFDI